MPWNDLYGTSRYLFPGIMYPVVVVQPRLSRARLNWASNGASLRRYWLTGPLSVIPLFRKLCQKQDRKVVCKNRGRLILHVHNPTLVFVALLVKAICPSVIVMCNLHNEWSGFRLWQRLSLHILVKLSWVTVCVSRSISETVPTSVRNKLMKHDKLRAILNGIRSVELERDFPIERLMDNRNADVVVIARMVPQKNVFFVMRCFALLKGARNLIWFGDGVLRDELQNYARELGVDQRIEWRGIEPRARVFEALWCSSIYLACSKWEGIGVANLEAAALGAQPFLSDIAPHREIARPLGLETFCLGDEAKWVRAMDKFLAEDVDIRKQKSFELIQKARAVFDLEESVKAYMNVYRELSQHAESV